MSDIYNDEHLNKIKEVIKDVKLRGSELLKAVIDQIKARPDLWDQNNWHTCYTEHCIAGWCEVLAFPTQWSERKYSTKLLAQELLGITIAESEYLFFGVAYLHQVEAFYEKLRAREQRSYEESSLFVSKSEPTEDRHDS